ncbi:MAG: hypothetical protein U0531_03145 [Dehalococcoidia bacterium]
MPAALSLLAVLAVVVFLTQYVQPVTNVGLLATPRPGVRSTALNTYAISLGLAGIIVYAALITGSILLLARRWRRASAPSPCWLVGLPPSPRSWRIRLRSCREWCWQASWETACWRRSASTMATSLGPGCSARRCPRS